MAIKIVTQSKDLPELCEGSFFHSRDLFVMLEQTPRVTPYMVIATNEKGNTIGQILVQIRIKRRFFFINFTRRARIYGEGSYDKTLGFKEKSMLFEKMITILVRHLKHRFCYHIELSDMSKKMFGYRALRKNGFVPIPWIQLHHSLHSKSPEKRASKKVLHRVRKAYAGGFATREAVGEEEIHRMYILIKKYFILRKQRYIPAEELFRQIGASRYGHIYVTTYKNKIVGGSAVVDSGKESMLWFHAALDKRYLVYHPNYVTVWHTLQDAFNRGQDHLHILNLGLPFSHSPYRDFMLSFGGKQVSSYRWFRFSNSLMRSFMFWYYRL